MHPKQPTRIVLLPGLHGTKNLFQSFAEQSPPDFEIVTISFLPQEQQSYESLVEVVLSKLDGSNSNLIILAESFSGPLALFVASRKPNGLKGVILAASFVLPPGPFWAKWLPWKLAFFLTRPMYALRSALSSEADIIHQISRELQRVSPAVLAHRVRSTLSVDATGALRDCPVPIMYIAGSKDIVIRTRSLREIVAIRGDVLVRKVNAPHFVLQSAATEVWSHVREFAEKCCAA